MKGASNRETPFFLFMETPRLRPWRGGKEKGPQPREEAGGPGRKAGGALLSHAPGRSTIAAGALNVRVREGNGCDSPAKATGHKINNRKRKERRGRPQKGRRGAPGRRVARDACFCSSPPAVPLSRAGGGRSGQAARPIRTGLLRPSRALRTRPVHPVVFRGPSACSRTGRDDLRGGLALRCLQRLSRCGVATRRCP